MGIRVFSPEQLLAYLHSRKAISTTPYENGLFLSSDNKFWPAEKNFTLGDEFPWKLSLTPYKFGVWFSFANTGIPKAPSREELWEIGFITNVMYELIKLRYSNEDFTVFMSNEPIVDSAMNEALPFYARDQLEYGVASYSFMYSKSASRIVTPEKIAKAVTSGKLSGLKGDPPLFQLWLEDSPSAEILDVNSNGHGLMEFQRVLIIKAWLATCPKGGTIPRDGWLFESQEYCMAYGFRIPKRNPFEVVQIPVWQGFGFAAPANFRPTSVDLDKFQRAKKKSKAVEWKSLAGVSHFVPPVTGGPTANERLKAWVTQK